MASRRTQQWWLEHFGESADYPGLREAIAPYAGHLDLGWYFAGVRSADPRDVGSVVDLELQEGGRQLLIPIFAGNEVAVLQADGDGFAGPPPPTAALPPAPRFVELRPLPGHRLVPHLAGLGGEPDGSGRAPSPPPSAPAGRRPPPQKRRAWGSG